jgi:DNA-binding Lrp family transcriptional regulator
MKLNRRELNGGEIRSTRRGWFSAADTAKSPPIIATHCFHPGARAPLSKKTMAELSELDEQIIALIEQSGRRSNRDIAKLLGISERQAGVRLSRLIAEDLIRVITVVDAFAVGFDIILALGVQVAERAAFDVAQEMAQLPNVLAAALMTGQYDIELMVAVDSHATLAAFVQNDLAAIAGVRSLHPSLFLDVAKYETGAGPVSAFPAKLAIPENSIVNEVDRAIIAKLWENAWETNENIATALGLSESTVRVRVNQLRARNLIHITAMRNVAIGQDVAFAIIGIEIEAGQQQTVIDALCAQRQLHLVARVLGRYDIVAQALVRNNAELATLLSTVIAKIPGVKSVSCAQALQIVKYDYRWRIAGPRAL